VTAVMNFVSKVPRSKIPDVVTVAWNISMGWSTKESSGRICATAMGKSIANTECYPLMAERSIVGTGNPTKCPAEVF